MKHYSESASAYSPSATGRVFVIDRQHAQRREVRGFTAVSRALPGRYFVGLQFPSRPGPEIWSTHDRLEDAIKAALEAMALSNGELTPETLLTGADGDAAGRAFAAARAQKH